MPVIISTKDKETTFEDKEIITVGNQANCDVVVNISINFILSIEINKSTGVCNIVNTFSSPQILFRGQPMGAKLSISKACKLMIAGSDEFIAIKTQPIPVEPNTSIQEAPQSRPVNHTPQVTMTSIAEQDFDEDDIRELYGDKINAATKIKLDKRKADIEMRRVGILKEVSFALEDAKKKITANGNAEKFLNIALVVCPIIMASAISDTLQNLVVGSAMTKSFFPMYMRLLAGYAILLFVTALIMKQGLFLLLQEKVNKGVQKGGTGAVAKNFMLLLSSSIFMAIGGALAFFYFDPETSLGQGQTIVSTVALFTLVLCAICSGYFKSTMNEAILQFDKYENREDFKKVLQDYQQWIGLYINNLSSVKLKNIRDKQFNKKIKASGEILLGILTSPFLAYGVSNTLASCFPEAAGWVRISGMRFSPVFLVLSTFMIIFAFFSLTSAFVSTKRANGAEVIKNDGFNNFMNHGVDLFGSEAMKKIRGDGFRSFLIAMVIILIEFTMNVSYFIQEIGGGEWGGIMLSMVAAMVPTSLLIAETFMLSHTQFEIHTCDELLSRLDKEI